jgi:putative peptidoglycan lipid II flippase
MVRTRHLLRSSVIVIFLFGLGKLTGLVRARLVAQTFGTSPAFDAFTAANQLPEVFFVVIAGGSLAAAFIPVYSQYLTQHSSRESARLANTILTLVLIVLGTISAVGALLAPWLTRVVLVPDFPPEQQMLTAEIMRIILIQTTIFGVSGVFSSMLNAHQHFALPALAPVALDIGYVIGLFLFVPSMGIVGLAWGTVIGGLLHIAIQVPALIKYRLGYRPQLDLRLPGVREVIHLMGPRIVTLGTVQFADLVTIRLASGLPSGSTSAYFYAYALMQLPQTLFGTAIALVVFPTLAELYNAADIDGLKRTAGNAIAVIWTLTIPAAAVTLLLGREIIGLLFQGGAFDAEATALVYTILAVFSVRIVSESTLEIVARLFYAQHNTRTPMLAYLGWLVVTGLLAVLLVGRIGIAGLALATTIGFTLLAAVLFELNRRALGGLGGPRLWQTLWRVLVATTALVAAIVVTGRLSDSWLIDLVLGLVAGGAAYLAVLWILGGAELRSLWSLLRRQSSQSSEL